MLSQLPTNIDKVPKEKLNQEILRAGMIAELDAVNFYEQMAELATDKSLKEILLDVAREEKTHVGEFQTLLLRLDQEQGEELEKGRKEAEEHV
ncbi:MAG: rubrerythrin [Candidatus Nealsonbacteria bacterium RIFOXYB1_FULL_40_15]|uniref:Rubrerythrin n=2 Tax=Candidatus Nealsoniibacteriota TaxID=1817911 RepID=A0A1G2ESW1_9BACT|nr:MAG: rubrerythrin [Candidatus Nealsonbacteria bacterium RIFOXYB1_FULL_40_15]OGZ28451.1 MAG: rubrerythrin [Candidatus Nealsonbacteria bacterium RIFOXYC1_FULL_40_7]OGZ29862.1 MAG: rubrerythrin [Candidatus Nealsonbacteria bacterium RIFOXYD1_FULL_39_11]